MSPDDYGGVLRLGKGATDACGRMRRKCWRNGVSHSSAALPAENNHYGLCMERYEDERPGQKRLPGRRDIRVLQREIIMCISVPIAGYFTSQWFAKYRDRHGEPRR